LPKAIQNPLAVFRRAAHIGSYVILTELRQGGKNFVAAIETNSNSNRGKLEVNSIRSIHPRTTNNIANWINEGLMDYGNKEKLSEWLAEKIKSRSYLNSSTPADVKKLLDSAAKIVQEFENPKNPKKKIRDGKEESKEFKENKEGDGLEDIAGNGNFVKQQKNSNNERNARTEDEVSSGLGSVKKPGETDGGNLGGTGSEVAGTGKTASRLDQHGRVGRSALRAALVRGAQGDRIMEAIEAGDRRAGNGATTAAGRGSWEKERFLGALEITAREMEAAFEEKEKRIEKLSHSKSVEITGNEITPSEDLKVYKKNALEFGKGLRGEDRGGKINTRLSGLKEALRHDYKDVEHLQSVAAIPQIIENSIYLDRVENEDPEKNSDVESYDYYAVGLKIGSVDYTVKAVIANGRNGKRYYDHKLTQIEKGKLLESATGNKPSDTKENSLSDIKDSSKLRESKESKEKNQGWQGIVSFLQKYDVNPPINKI
jgi:hypothetical protein